MFYTGTSRLSSDIAGALIANMGKKAAQLRKMKKLIDKALKILGNGCPLDDFGELLHENWMIKRELTDTISNDTVDGLYETAQAHGAIGGKLLGAGGSGFMVFYVPRKKKRPLSGLCSDICMFPSSLRMKGVQSFIIVKTSNGHAS